MHIGQPKSGDYPADVQVGIDPYFFGSDAYECIAKMGVSLPVYAIDGNAKGIEGRE